ncbi:MAG: TlpA disulfide reductase family protein [Chloroflexota bacterium]
MKKSLRFYLVLSLGIFILCACKSAEDAQDTATTPDWFNVELTDVQTDETFTMNDYAGKVVLLETMAVWCPTCILQAAYIYKLHDLLGHPDDLISVSLDVDLNEDTADLKQYTAEYGFDWHFAIAPLEIDRALGNLYSAQYLNPPLAPMLIIDRQGNVHLLPYGLKDTETLQEAVEPYLNQ